MCGSGGVWGGRPRPPMPEASEKLVFRKIEGESFEGAVSNHSSWPDAREGARATHVLEAACRGIFDEILGRTAGFLR